MAHFYCSKPVCWEMFRNEPIESQNRRAAIRNSHSLANETRREDTGMWWSSQRHVDQVVPAEFVDPTNIDPSTYRYQVFARPPPIQCPTSLKDVTDEPQPVRYNIKRVAVDKPFPMSPVPPCPEQGPRCSTQSQNMEDCSRNNNTLNRANLSKFARKKLNPLPFAFNYNKPVLCRDYQPNGGHIIVRRDETNNAATAKEMKNTTDLNETDKTDAENTTKEAHSKEIVKNKMQQRNGNNSQSTGSVLSPKTKLHRGSHLPPLSSHITKSSQEQRFINQQPEIVVGIDSDVESKNKELRNFSRVRSMSKTNNSLQKKAAVPNVGLPARKPTPMSPKPNVSLNKKINTNANNVATKLKYETSSNDQLYLDPVRLGPSPSKPSVSSAKSTLNSRTASPSISPMSVSSNSTTMRKTQVSGDKTIKPPFKLLGPLKKPEIKVASWASLRDDQSEVCFSSKSRNDTRDAKKFFSASMVSETYGRRKFVSSPKGGCRDNVASLLCDANQNNTYSTPDQYDVVQDTFSELFVSFTRCNPILLKGNDNDNTEHILITSVCDAIGQETLNTRHCNTLLNDYNGTPFLIQNLCVNNNADVETTGGNYTLQCWPVPTCGIPSSNPCVNQSPKMLCQFHGRQPPKTQGNGHMILQMEQMRPSGPTPNRADRKPGMIPQGYGCRFVTTCATGKPIVGAIGEPMVVCEPVRPKTPEIGYGTYKIVGSIQRRQRPFPNTFAKLELPPDLEEYREFTRRCPNYQRGRYDRCNPLNEMLLPSNKTSTLLGGFNINPYSYSRMPKREQKPLFEPLKTNSDLSWSLPGFVTNRV